MWLFELFAPRKPEVLHHWIALTENFQYSTADFYASIEADLKTRAIPNLDIAHVDFAEGGILSHKRTYLRMTRERLVFDVCAAPFGTGYFFSCRMAEFPPVIRLWQLLALAGGCAFLAYFTLYWFSRWFGVSGLMLWPVFWLLTLGITVYVLRNAVAMGLRDLDMHLVKSPLFGPIYERWFRKETYYREDTRLLYLQIIPKVVEKQAEEVTAAKGVKLQKQYERKPILGELYQPKE